MRRETGYFWPEYPTMSLVYASLLHYYSALLDLLSYALLVDTVLLPAAAKREKAGVLNTLGVLTYRATVQMFRSLDYYAFAIFVTVSATVVVGALNGVSERLYLVPSDGAMPMCILGLMSAVQGLYTFLPERLTTFREASSGATWTASYGSIHLFIHSFIHTYSHPIFNKSCLHSCSVCIISSHP